MSRTITITLTEEDAAKIERALNDAVHNGDVDRRARHQEAAESFASAVDDALAKAGIEDLPD